MTEAYIWGPTLAVVIGLLVFDFTVVIRKPHDPSFKESVWWSAFYISAACAFGVVLHAIHEPFSATEYFAGYITEKSLSVDNLFVFLVIMTRFAVPSIFRSRVLLIGIVIALVLRGLFIAGGAAALSAFSWVFYIFGAILLWTAIGLVREGPSAEMDPEYKEARAVRVLRRYFPVTDGYRDGRITVREAGKTFVTPLLLVMVAIGTTDVLFALDSIPAIFGLTQDPFIVFTANAFALMGLRQLFFLVHGLLKRLIYLTYGLAVILVFIGVKLVFEALHQNTLPFINGGEHLDGVPKVSIEVSLAVIVGTVVVSAVASLLVSAARKSRADADASAEAEQADS